LPLGWMRISLQCDAAFQTPDRLEVHSIHGCGQHV
jgi:hypothetical protein